jgi:hypothetical protein
MFRFCGQASSIPFFVDKPPVNCFCQAADLLITGSNDTVQSDCYDFVHTNVGNPALNTRPTILNLLISKMVQAG